MTDLSKLSHKQLKQLEKQIEQRKQILRRSKDCVDGYKITFCVKFNPAIHSESQLDNPVDFGDYLANDIANTIVDYFCLRQSDVSGFEVEEMTDIDRMEWKDFWENENE